VNWSVLEQNWLKIGKDGENGMVFFVGEYPRQLDERNRFILPAKIREKLSATVYVTRSPAEKCLNLYSEEEWNVIAEKVRALPTGTDRNAAMFQRRLFGKAMSCELDKQGRVPLTQDLIDFAGLKKDIIVVGSNTKLEIWDVDMWNQINEGVDEDFILSGIEKYEINI